MGEHLLFLAHRIPYPPDKGDKIRSYHLLRHLAERYQVHLGAFVDDSRDWHYHTELESLCREVFLQEIRPARRKLASLRGLLNGHPLTLPYYASARMQAWVDALLDGTDIGKAVLFCSPMAQYLDGERYSHLRRVVDFVDIDSDKWAQYARSKSWPMSWIYGREARTLFRYEQHIATRFDATVFVSDDESRLFRRLVPEAADRVNAIHNGVDTDYFSPRREYANPYGDERPRLVFTGAMDYWANVDAVTWFARNIFKRVRNHIAEAEFWIVGSKPAAEVLALKQLPGVTVTGRVEDVRPYLAHARAVVAPMRIARGVQNKVLEAMAMARPVVVTPEAAEGISATPGEHFLLAAGTAEIARAALASLRGEQPATGNAARAYVEANHGWASHLSRFSELLVGPSEETPR
ncbi:MAG TPA: TIGR03087 family PEP-CTERM/XrtA system glycosyltransferase [Gammaproteobacteria bacterium]|nr:TIGR03087 family PEP-CTERM/XrtA system glycosyltransferase [Gammaproteobacteria bacterium]